MPERHDQTDGEYRQRAERPRRRPISVWSILAPAAAVALFIVFFVALSNSCLSSGCHTTKSKKDPNAPANNLKPGARAKVKAGDSMGTIANRFHLDIDDLKACNPSVDPQAIQPGQYLVVSAATCQGADLAGVGANPDPLSGETSAGAGSAATANSGTKQVDGSTNGTAATDPSAGGKGSASPAPSSTKKKTTTSGTTGQ